ncbi:UBX domain-containing protein 7 [Phlebotomus papatasi]|uniref:UBX domain-containing protein 7 n=1 Tax=Phlebotomus papatasi TaxID=29031 RepID=UPI0024845190|nr:UBX domain-containing protein 7 [Phlebotomus papatasi]
MSGPSSSVKGPTGRVSGQRSAPKGKIGRAPTSVATFRNFEREAELMSDGGAPPGKRVCLSDLFRPPVELLHRGTWESGREMARTTDKWLLVNLQDNGDFKCQCLNRDVWSDGVIREILQKYFIMCQVSSSSEEGEKFSAFYHATSLPFVTVIDPRTGGAADTWPSDLQPDDVRTRLLHFLRRQPSPSAPSDSREPSPEPVLPSIAAASTTKSIPVPTPDALSEEEQLRLAIENSLRETTAAESVASGATSKETTRIQLRLPSDTTELLTWSSSATIEQLGQHVRQHHGATIGCKLICAATRTNLLTLPPPTTLKEAQLHPSAVLYLHLDDD